MWCNRGEVLGLTGVAGMGFWLQGGGGVVAAGRRKRESNEE